MDIAKEVKELIKSGKYESQQAVAVAMDVCPSQLSRWVKGKRKMSPAYRKLVKQFFEAQP